MILSVPATSANLGPGLDVLGLSLDFRNEFHITPARETTVEIYGEGEGVQRFLGDNMFVRIFRKSLEEMGVEAGDFRFVFHNKIPISRGLGSSSAVIVGAISAAHRVAGLPLNRQAIVDKALAFEHHPDNITPATFGGFTIAMLERGVDSGRVFAITHELPSCLRAVVAIPSRPTFTKYSRELLPRRYASYDVIYNMSHASVLSAAIMQGRWELLRLASRDRLHQERRMRKFPLLFSIQKCALENGALMSTLSGSGSSFLSLCLEDDAPRLQEILQKRFQTLRVVALRLDNEGVSFVDERLES